MVIAGSMLVTYTVDVFHSAVWFAIGIVNVVVSVLVNVTGVAIDTEVFVFDTCVVALDLELLETVDERMLPACEILRLKVL